MHSEIVRDKPGSCPICGMALEPRTVSVEEDNPELREMTKRFWVSARSHSPDSRAYGFGDAFGDTLTEHPRADSRTLIGFNSPLPHRLFFGAAFLSLSAVGSPSLIAT